MVWSSINPTNNLLSTYYVQVPVLVDRDTVVNKQGRAPLPMEHWILREIQILNTENIYYKMGDKGCWETMQRGIILVGWRVGEGLEKAFL
jgi:hypothetical protein